jgi:hypothetical protein
MKRVKLTLLIPLITLCINGTLLADAEHYYLAQLRIAGNRITNEEYIRSFITLQEGRMYDLDGILSEINRSRDNLEKTDLFSQIFFNDEFDKKGNLSIVVQLKEKNYLFFGPTGFIVYEDEHIFSDAGLYFSYENLFGNGGIVYGEFPVYENVGMLLRVQGAQRKFILSAEVEYVRSLNDGDTFSRISPEATYRYRETLSFGILSSLNIDSGSSLLFQPFLETGRKKRYSLKMKRWAYGRFAPFYGFYFDTGSYYGADFEARFHRDLLLKILYNLRVGAVLQGGDVPENLILTADVRGTYPQSRTGNKLFSVVNEFHIPLPWEESVVIVPFIDANLLGYSSLDFFFGGGIGVHLFTKYQNPLVAEIAFGKGVMLNLRKRF